MVLNLKQALIKNGERTEICKKTLFLYLPLQLIEKLDRVIGLCDLKFEGVCIVKELYEKREWISNIIYPPEKFFENFFISSIKELDQCIDMYWNDILSSRYELTLYGQDFCRNSIIKTEKNYHFAVSIYGRWKYFGN